MHENQKSEAAFFRAAFAFMIWLMIVSSLLMGCATHPETKPPGAIGPSAPLTLEEKWGIERITVRLWAAGYMMQFRYRVIDPEKASELLNRQTKAYLIDQATGTKLGVPISKLGAMRTTAVKPEANRDYFILFSNPGGLVKNGDRVTVVIGDFRAENLIVE